MPASNAYTADAPQVGQSHTTLNEPSMEDILASIRRIIAEDQSNSLGRSGLTGLARRASQTAPTPAPEIAPVDSHTAEAAAPAELEGLPAEPTQDAPAAEVHASQVPPAEVHNEHAEGQHDEHELRGSYGAVENDHSAATHGEVAAAEVAHPPVKAENASAGESVSHIDSDDRIHDLSASDRVPSLNDQEPLISSSAGASITSSFQTLADTVLMQDPGLVERIMRETLRPMLKTWLDDHLPSLVERLVRAEIERVARGGRSRD